jgi:hypothetical protein
MGCNYKAEIQANYQVLQNQLVQQSKCLSFGDAEEAPEKDLNSFARFVIPGNASLSYQNPIFNNNGDLVIEAKYVV